MLKLMTPMLALASMNAIAASPVCSDAGNIDDELRCLYVEVNKVETLVGQYLDAITKRFATNSALLARLETSQNSWLATRFGRCNLVGILPRDEKQHTAKHMHCRYQVILERSQNLWDIYLRDSEGVLPEMPER